jgi:tetratricopeptide (TPR) repeat protein
MRGAKWYAKHPEPPERTPGMRLLTSDSTNEAVIHGLQSDGIIAAMSTPRAPLFTGKVFVLINERTGSASEPPAEALRATGRATLIGHRTGGAMLMALPHRVGDGWVILFPEADYVTAAGKPIEGVGVAPDIEVPTNHELLVVADSVEARSPVAAALLRANAYWALNRWAEAERYYRELERLAPASINGRWGLVSVAMAQKQWDKAFALVDERARVDSSPNVAILRSRVAAQSKRDIERSITELRAIVNRRPPYSAAMLANAHRRLAFVFLAAGDTTSAVPELEAALKIEPRDAETLSTMARLRGR